MNKISIFSYKQIIKNISILGLVQIIIILVSIFRSKFIALTLGPIGFGLSGMFIYTINMISSATNFGLSSSAVRDISAAYESKNSNRISIITVVLSRLVLITGILGMIITMVLSPLLSYISFSNYNYSKTYLFLSIILLFNQLNNCNLILLQGSRNIILLTKANLYGAIIGLITSVPIYYILGYDGLVVALICSSIVSYFISLYFRKKISTEKVYVSFIRTIAEGKQMLKLGFLISFTGFINLGFNYLLRLFISKNGNLIELGLYSAGFTIISTYFGLIFTSLGTDYYPRLSSVSNDLYKSTKTINNQIEISLSILGPILIIFILFIKLIIKLLYTNQFLIINNMLIWAAFGIFFKTVSWCIAFYFLAKGSNRLYFWNEILTNSYLLIINLVFYFYFGITGLGYAFAISYFLYMIQVYFICHHYYNFIINKNVLNIFFFQLITIILCLYVIFNFSGIFLYLYSVLLLLFSILFSFKKISKRIF